MRYNRLTREIEITVGDLCALKYDNGVCNIAEVYEYISQHSITTETIIFKYLQGDITFSLKLELTRRGDVLCEINERAENGDFLPVRQDTSIIAFAYCSMQHCSDVKIESAVISDDGVAFDTVIRNKTYSSLEKLFLRRLARLTPIAEMLRELSSLIPKLVTLVVPGFQRLVTRNAETGSTPYSLYLSQTFFSRWNMCVLAPIPSLRERSRIL